MYFPTILDNCYAQALPILLAEHREIQFIVIGCGGTGGFLIPMLARLIIALQEKRIEASLVLIDPDIIELKNIPRQNFVQPEIGLNKAEVLATRYSLAYGIKIAAIAAPFTVEMVKREWQKLLVLIGCVDNSSARQEIAKALDSPYSYDTEQIPKVWWLDCGNYGNGIAGGQVLLGSTHQIDLKTAFNDSNQPSFCLHLPSPSLQHPQLLQILSEDDSNSHLSCAEISLSNQQALFINQRVAAEAIEILSQLLLSKTLKRFATYFHCGSGSSQSLYITTKTIANFAHN